MSVTYTRLIVSIAFTVVSVTILLIAIANHPIAEELSVPYMAVMLVAGGLLMWSKR